ncbi:MAG: hypothetical protein FWB76_04730 [Oscillospiraceae bacterium]|nr:hypothetical protein [Oscillospiraceae bacterium]
MDNLGNWASVLGLIITVITLLMMLNIRSKIDRSLGKHRFMEQRDVIITELNELREAIRCGGDYGQLDEQLLRLRELLLQLANYRIWRPSDRVRLEQHIRFLSKTYNGEKKCSCKEHVMRIDVIIAMVKAQAAV